MGFACDRLALSETERHRHRDLLQRLRPAANDVQELIDGYAFHLNDSVISLVEAAEWVSLERRCCPFLAFQLQTSGGESTIVLSVTGPPGVKSFINLELR
jgi:hypothetical protein